MGKSHTPKKDMKKYRAMESVNIVEQTVDHALLYTESTEDSKREVLKNALGQTGEVNRQVTSVGNSLTD